MLCRELRVCCTNCWQFAPQLCVRLNFRLFLFIASTTQTQKPGLVWPQQMSALHPAPRCGAELCCSRVQDCAPSCPAVPAAAPSSSCVYLLGLLQGLSQQNPFQIPSSLNALSKQNQAPCVEWVCSLKYCWKSRQSSEWCLKLCWSIVQCRTDLWSWIVLVSSDRVLMVHHRVGCPEKKREPRLEEAGEDSPRLGKWDSTLPPKCGGYQSLQKWYSVF